MADSRSIEKVSNCDCKELGDKKVSVPAVISACVISVLLDLKAVIQKPFPCIFSTYRSKNAIDIVFSQ